MSVSIQFLGAAGTVTGSKYLVRSGRQSILVDCGLFQGERSWRERNWQPPAFKPAEVGAVLLTHAHVDHVGMLPRYASLGLTCPVHCTEATATLGNLILLDSGRLQEEEAAWRAERGRSRHHPPLPLYTEAEAREALTRFRTVSYHRRVEVLPGIFAEWRRMGHILGAASIRLEVGGRTIQFSGDIGRYDTPILCDPEPVPPADLLLIESTYGDKLHHTADTGSELEAVINRTVRRRGVVLVPSFAVGRTQQLLYFLRELKEARRIPSDLPVIVDSPMAREATASYARHPDEYDHAAVALLRSGRAPFMFPKLHFISDRQESIQLNRIQEPMVIISASGMLTGGRILHHLRHRISSPLNTVLFVGFQPPGGRGAWIKSGAPSLRLFSEEVPIRAEIAEISALSAHGDRSELLRWCREGMALAPGDGRSGRVAVVHGEPDVAERFRLTLEEELGWNAAVPRYLEEWTL